MLSVTSSKTLLWRTSLFRLPILTRTTHQPQIPPISKLKLICTHYSSNRGKKGTSHHLDMATLPLPHLMPLWGFLALCPDGSTKYALVKAILLPTLPGSTGMQTHYASTVRRMMRPSNMLSFTAQLKLKNGSPISQGSPTSAPRPHYGTQLCSSKDWQTTSQLLIRGSRPQPSRLRSTLDRTVQPSGFLLTTPQDLLTQLKLMRLFFVTLYFITCLRIWFIFLKLNKRWRFAKFYLPCCTLGVLILKSSTILHLIWNRSRTDR